MSKIDAVIALVPYIESANIIPLAPALLKGILKANGCEVKTTDLNVAILKLDDAEIFNYLCGQAKLKTPKAKLTYRAFIKDSVKHLLAYEARWIGLSIFSYCSHIFAIDLLRELKAQAPNQLVALGGSRMDLPKWDVGLPFNEYVYQEGLADAINIGEGEQTIVEIIKHNRKGIITQPQLLNKELVGIPVPDFDDYNLSDYGDLETVRLPITASKGCVRDCTFCDVGLAWPKFRFRSSIDVANEMKHIRSRHGVKNFFFTDSLVNGGLKPFRELLENLVGTDLRWSGQFICRGERDMKPELFDLMRASGCYKVSIGVESGSDAVRADMRKGFVNEDLHYAASQLIRVGILQSWNIMIGYPSETVEDFNETLALIERYKDEELVTINPVGLTVLIKDTYLGSQEYLDQMGISFPTEHDHLDWFSIRNPTNTIEERIRRWDELIALVNQYGLVREPFMQDIVRTKERQIQAYRERNQL